MDRWSDIFYPGGVVPEDERAKLRTEHRMSRVPRHGGPDSLDMLDVLRYIAIPKEKLSPMLKEIEEQWQAEAHARVEEKVNTWKENLGA